VEFKVKIIVPDLTLEPIPNSKFTIDRGRIGSPNNPHRFHKQI
jgi:hypothetical protein